MCVAPVNTQTFFSLQFQHQACPVCICIRTHPLIQYLPVPAPHYLHNNTQVTEHSDPTEKHENTHTEVLTR